MNENIRAEIDAYYENWFRLNEAYSAWAQKRGTTDNLLFTLYEIGAARQDCTQQLICKKLFLPKQTVSFLLAKLEKQGIIVRKENPKDRRNKLIFLTESGREYAHHILSALDEAEIRAFRSMPPRARKAMTEGLRAFADAVAKSFSEE